MLASDLPWAFLHGARCLHISLRSGEEPISDGAARILMSTNLYANANHPDI